MNLRSVTLLLARDCGCGYCGLGQVSVIARSICITLGDWGAKTCPLYGIERCPLFRGFFTIEVYGATIRTWESVRYKGGVRSSEVSVNTGSTV